VCNGGVCCAGFSLPRASCCLWNSLNLRAASLVSVLYRSVVKRRHFHRAAGAAGAAAAHHAPSEILEPFRNLGRCPPVTPRKGGRCIRSNQAFSPGGNRGEPVEEGGGSVFAASIAKRGVEGSQAGNPASHAGRRRSMLLLIILNVGKSRDGSL